MLRALPLALVIALAIAASGCGGSSSQSNLHQSGPVLSTKVVVTPATANIYTGMTAKFQAKVVGQSNQKVTWSLQKGSLGTIDSTGLYTAPPMPLEVPLWFWPPAKPSQMLWEAGW